MSEIERIKYGFRITHDDGLESVLIYDPKTGLCPYDWAFAIVQKMQEEHESLQKEVEQLSKVLKQSEDFIESLRHIHLMPDEAIEKIDFYQLLNKSK